MSQQTKIEVLSELRRRYVSAGRQPKRKLIAQAVELLGSHRKAAIRALRNRPQPILLPAVRVGRPRQYPADTLLPILKPIWFAAYPPCGSRLVALLPEWVPAYEQDHRPLEADVRESLLAVSARTLDRLLAPLRVSRRYQARQFVAPEHSHSRRMDGGRSGLAGVGPRGVVRGHAG